MRGTSLPEDKLAGNLGNVIEATSIGGRRSDFFTAGKLAPGSLGLFQQHRPTAVMRRSGFSQRKLNPCPHFASRDFLF
jgi:hypothetical protein